MNRFKLILILIPLLAAGLRLPAQVSFSDNGRASAFYQAMELFNKEKYPAAIRLFDNFLTEAGDQNTTLLDDAEYYAALSALRLFNPDGEYRMVMFMATHPESPHKNNGKIDLADYFYQNRNYRKAVTWYADVDRFMLGDDKQAQYFFRYGHSLYMRGDKQKALLMFDGIKDIDTPYTPPAIYYSAQIAYEDKMYDTALEGFSRLQDDPTFGPVVPFYIVQILYLKKDYDQILAMGPGLLKSAPADRAAELHRFIGDAYYNKGRYAEAVPHLENYTSKVKTAGREDRYQLGYSYYKTGEIDKAIQVFLGVGARSDLISQNIWHILGDCYIQKDDKERARFAFGEASKLTFDDQIAEESLFNYARLTYETSYSPFGEAIEAFRTYIDKYPGSDRIEEAYNYLVATFMQIKNYKAALASLDKIQNKDSRLEEAYQRVTFFRGLELLNNMELEAAVAMFDRSLMYERYNRDIRARALYWRGESAYRLGRYAAARNDYQEFMGIPGASSLEEYRLVRYNLAYTWFNLNEYQPALDHFKAFETAGAASDKELLDDTRCRIADCYFITTNYPMAISYYDKVTGNGRSDIDYAMFQKAFAMGLMNDHKGKVDVLTSLISKYRSSSLVPNAIFERGRAYIVMENIRAGEADFNTVITSYPSSPYVPRTIVQLGLLYYNLGENNKAIEQYKKVIENFRTTPEARYALTGLKNVYVDMNDVETYFAYAKTLGDYGDVSRTERDSLLYMSGENLYIEGNCERAKEVFRNYLKEFSEGSFSLNARYYLAECLRTSGENAAALTLYQDVIAVPSNPFMEQSLAAAAGILFADEDYPTALRYYERLETIAATAGMLTTSLRGQLRAAYETGDAQKTIRVSGKIADAAGIPDELSREALFMKAKAHYSLNEFDEALAGFRKVATEITSAEGAESKYRVAELLFKKNLPAESEKVVNEFITQNTPHQFWMARMFLLLSDIGVGKGDILQARATLQSLREYYTVTDDGILDEVREKLAAIDAMEKSGEATSASGN